jgi:hypothetical protein
LFTEHARGDGLHFLDWKQRLHLDRATLYLGEYLPTPVLGHVIPDPFNCVQ